MDAAAAQGIAPFWSSYARQEEERNKKKNFRAPSRRDWLKKLWAQMVMRGRCHCRECFEVKNSFRAEKKNRRRCRSGRDRLNESWQLGLPSVRLHHRMDELRKLWRRTLFFCPSSFDNAELLTWICLCVICSRLTRSVIKPWLDWSRKKKAPKNKRPRRRRSVPVALAHSKERLPNVTQSDRGHVYFTVSSRRYSFSSAFVVVPRLHVAA